MAEKKSTVEKKTVAKTTAKSEVKAKKPVSKKSIVNKEPVFISEADQYVFGQGSHYDIYKKLGSHPSYKDGKKGVYFAVWAPNAQSISVVGDFNGWN